MKILKIIGKILQLLSFVILMIFQFCLFMIIFGSDDKDTSFLIIFLVMFPICIITTELYELLIKRITKLNLKKGEQL
jgi:hypothetical protein